MGWMYQSVDGPQHGHGYWDCDCGHHATVTSGDHYQVIMINLGGYGPAQLGRRAMEVVRQHLSYPGLSNQLPLEVLIQPTMGGPQHHQWDGKPVEGPRQVTNHQWEQYSSAAVKMSLYHLTRYQCKYQWHLRPPGAHDIPQRLVCMAFQSPNSKENGHYCHVSVA